MAAFLRQIGGRQIDGDAARWQRQPGSNQCRAHALLGFGNSLVGQADDVKGRQAGRDLHLDVNGAGVDALESDRRDTLNHRPRPEFLPRTVAGLCRANKNICRTKFGGYTANHKKPRWQTGIRDRKFSHDRP